MFSLRTRLVKGEELRSVVEPIPGTVCASAETYTSYEKIICFLDCRLLVGMNNERWN